MEKVEKAGLYKRLIARGDGFITDLRNSGMTQLGGYDGESYKAEVHLRGGDQAGVKDENGDIVALGKSKDIYHLYNTEFDLVTRFRLGKPKDGHYKMTEEDIDQKLKHWEYDKKNVYIISRRRA